MTELKRQVSRQLSEVFRGETQETTARKLNTTQGNVSKWVSGSQVPTSDVLCEISKTYKVSVDWILGISSQKEIDGVVLEKLTYEQITRIMDVLFQHKNFSIANLAELAPSEAEYEVDENGDSIPIIPLPRYDSDYIKVNDRLLSYLLEKYKLETGSDMLECGRKTSCYFMG
jgi:transcriptional regulator with XRE-family HTH domain